METESNIVTKPQKVRAFVAIHPDAPTLFALENLLRKLSESIPSRQFRWVRNEQLHLTLQFLAYIERARLPDYEKAVSEVCSRHAPFNVRVQTLGCFPSRKRLRVLWVGLAGKTDALQRIKVELDNAFSPLGYVPEKRDFHPHITLARINEVRPREIEQLGRELVLYEATTFGEWRAGKIDLMQSVLSPTGAKYTILNSFALRGGAD